MLNYLTMPPWWARPLLAFPLVLLMPRLMESLGLIKEGSPIASGVGNVTFALGFTAVALIVDWACHRRNGDAAMRRPTRGWVAPGLAFPLWALAPRLMESFGLLEAGSPVASGAGNLLFALTLTAVTLIVTWKKHRRSASGVIDPR